MYIMFSFGVSLDFQIIHDRISSWYTLKQSINLGAKDITSQYHSKGWSEKVIFSKWCIEGGKKWAVSLQDHYPVSRYAVKGYRYFPFAEFSSMYGL